MKKLLLIVCMTFAISVPSFGQSWLRALSGALKAGQAMTISDKDFADMVRLSVASMDRSNKVCSANSAYTQRLKRLTRGMTNANGTPLNFKVYQTSEVNAFACPDGSIRVYSALMDALSDNELLGVIGHEIGHVALRHSHKAWKSALLRSAASDALGAMSDTWATLSDSYLGSIASVALSAKHSREHEEQADDYGYAFLKKCGKNPWAMGQAFKKLKVLSKSGNSKYQKLLYAFSSHPDFDSRISRMRAKAKKDGYTCN
jgi:putative metalloprotease